MLTGIRFEKKPTIAMIVRKDTSSIALNGPSTTTSSDFPALGDAAWPKMEQGGKASQSTADTDITNHDVLFRAFPKPLLTLFAPKVTTTTHPAYGECLFLSGVGAFAYKSIFEWMISCQAARKEVVFSTGKELPYFKASRALIAARDINSEKAVNAILTRMQQLEYSMEFVRDIKMVYANNPSDELRKRIGKQIDSVRGFKWFVSYEGRVDELRQSIRAFDDDVRSATAARTRRP